MPRLKRRKFLIGSVSLVGAPVALAVGWASLPLRQRVSSDEPLLVSPGEAALNGWVKVSPDGSLTIMMAAIEMGQGSHTGAAMLLAEEMDADWSKVRLEQAGTDAIYNNQAALVDSLPFFAPDNHGSVRRATEHTVRRILRAIPGLSGTGGSSSIKDLWMPMRQAGAAARAMLVQAAARQWGVPAAECSARNGVVTHPTGKSATFGQLANSAAGEAIPAEITLKSAGDWTLIGRPVHRLDTRDKVTGKAVYGVDVKLDGLLYASVRMCPSVGGSVAKFAQPDAGTTPGVRGYVVLEPVSGGLGSVGMTSGGLAAIAASPYAAMLALARTTIEWNVGPAVGLSSKKVSAALLDALNSGNVSVKRDIGDATRGLKEAARVLEAVYEVPFLAHATMEPMSCTIQFKDGAATVWAASQMPGFARKAVADTLGIPQKKVTLNIPVMGGGFGRRTFTDYIVHAARVAREADGAPVQLLWPREEDMSHDYYRPAYAARYRAGLDSDGQLVALDAVAAGSSIGAGGFMDASAEGAASKFYAIQSFRVAHVTVEHPLPQGIWRSVHNSQNAFFFESFLDEIAHAGGKDPVRLRLDMLRSDPRAERVLEVAARRAAWGSAVQPVANRKVGRGVAVHSCFGSHAAQVVDAAVAADGSIQVTRVVCVVDCGSVVNPQLVRQQLEGAIIFGLSAAMHGEISFENGAVQQSNFHDYAPLRMNECPEIVIVLLDSDEKPGGVGELGTPPVAPALANAVYAATGQRLRRLPLSLITTSTQGKS